MWQKWTGFFWWFIYHHGEKMFCDYVDCRYQFDNQNIVALKFGMCLLIRSKIDFHAELKQLDIFLWVKDKI